jgi:predicted RNA-binding protein YlqC (UPF0109 family)
MNITNLIERLVKGLVGDQEAVTVTVKQLSRSINVFVQVGEFDQGKVLGQRRTTLDALIAVAEEAGRRSGKIVRIELLDPVKTTKTPPPHQFTAASSWDQQDFAGLLDSAVNAVFEYYELSEADIKSTVTVYEVLVKKSSPLHGRVHALQRPFEVLFHAIGKSFRHVCHVDLIPEE